MNSTPPSPEAGNLGIEITEEQQKQLLKKAKVDAGADPAGTEQCQSWRNTLATIVDMAMKQIEKKFDEFRDVCLKANEEIGRAHADVKALRAPAFIAGLEADANERMNSNNAQAALENIKDSTVLLNKYRIRFPHLDRSVQRPHKANIMLFLGFAILLIAVESAINSQLFAEASSYGLAGGALAAVSVSVLNVIPLILLAILAKLCLSNLNFPPWAWKVLCVVALVYAIGFNWFAMQIRNDLVVMQNIEVMATEQGDVDLMQMELMQPAEDCAKTRENHALDNRPLDVKKEELIARIQNSTGYSDFEKTTRISAIQNTNNAKNLSQFIPCSVQGVPLPDYLIKLLLERPLPQNEKNKGWMLFIIGLIVTAACFWKGWSFVDGYAKVRQLMETIDQAKKSYPDIVLAPIKENIDKVQSAQDILPKRIAELKATINNWRAVNPTLIPAVVAVVKENWNIYNREYALHHLDPDPDLPNLNVENASEHDIKANDAWAHFVQDISTQAEKNQDSIDQDMEEAAKINHE
ncbi:MAG: hypothetical protein ACR2P9_05600, partial [Gammaproteobacteria bacterium]